MPAAQKIVPHIWFDKEAVKAAEFYVSIFPASQITGTTVLRDTPSGDTDIVSFTLAGYAFQSINAGPFFKVNPSVSFTVNCATAGEVDALWERLADGGQAFMLLDAYPFNPRFGWVQDRFGVSWRLAVSEEETAAKPSITPSLAIRRRQRRQTAARPSGSTRRRAGSWHPRRPYRPLRFGRIPGRRGICMAAQRLALPAGRVRRRTFANRLLCARDSAEGRADSPVRLTQCQAASLAHIAQVCGSRSIKNLINAKLRQRLAQVLEETPPAAKQHGYQGDFQFINDTQVQVLLDHVGAS